ncbi:MAG: phenylphosphate carboxylase subunit gamma [Bacillota bacterium]
MLHYDVFVNSLADLPEGQEVRLAIRDLAPGTHKYCYSNVTALVSPDAQKYEYGLLVRFGRGQIHPAPYSIKILQQVERIPERWR